MPTDEVLRQVFLLRIGPTKAPTRAAEADEPQRTGPLQKALATGGTTHWVVAPPLASPLGRRSLSFTLAFGAADFFLEGIFVVVYGLGSQNRATVIATRWPMEGNCRNQGLRFKPSLPDNACAGRTAGIFSSQTRATLMNAASPLP